MARSDSERERDILQESRGRAREGHREFREEAFKGGFIKVGETKPHVEVRKNLSFKLLEGAHKPYSKAFERGPLSRIDGL